MVNKYRLKEATNRRDYMTDEEKILQKKLIKLLKDDGNGHHHAAYAKRLSKYDINIVPVGQQPKTAAISFDEGIIYINRGFLRDPKTFSQLNVIMRHELCHNLMMHQFRFIEKLKDIIPEAHLKTSMSIHEMMNTIKDFEISNKKYSAEDKEIVRNTWLNGKLISGLVTEDHREDWQNMSLEEMYDALTAEIEMKSNTGDLDWTKGDSGNLEKVAKDLYAFKDITTPADFNTIKDLKNDILKSARKYDHSAEIAENYLDIINTFEKLEVNNSNNYTKADFQKMLDAFADSSEKAIAKHDVVDPITGEVLCIIYTPEEKQLAVECLKTLIGNTSYNQDYNNWYKEIMKKLADSDYTDDEIKQLANILS